MRRVPRSGPELSFKPDDAVTFKHGKRENGVEALQGTIEITNNSSRVVNFRFADDPEFEFAPRAACIAPRSTTVVFATFYNVDGHCQPRRSSVVLRSIRVRSEDSQDVERLWKRTPAGLVAEKRWKLRFEQDQPLSTARSTKQHARQDPQFAEAPTGVGDAKWVPWAAAKTSTSWLPAVTRVAERSSWLLRSQLHLVVVVMGAVVLAAYYALWLAKSRHAPDAPEAARAWIKFRAKANEPSLPAETEAMKCARSLLLTQLLLTVTVVTGACLALWLVKLKRTPDVPDAPSLTDRWATFTANATKTWLSAAPRAVEGVRRLPRSQLLLAAVVVCAVVPTAYHALWLAKPRHALNSPDRAHAWMKYRFEGSMPSLPTATRATGCSRWRLLSQLLFAVVLLFGACLVRCTMKSKRAPDGPDTPSSTNSVTCGATEIEPWLVAATRTPKYAGWYLRSQLLRAANLSARWLHGSEMLRAVVVMTPVMLTICYVLWLFEYRHMPYWTDCVTVGNEKYCF
ncbi:uncharacterized protein [Dermacentor albipictus]|uniref:uncharacterized protein isoform X2 n=1 Tax=Dermacentor albipictus TaxID=60249 RepID=UPI0038FC6541